MQFLNGELIKQKDQSLKNQSITSKISEKAFTSRHKMLPKNGYDGIFSAETRN